jgi:hypothetical protein
MNNMVNIYELLNETPIAFEGNYEDPSKISNLTFDEYEKNWIYKGKIKTKDGIEYVVIQNKNTDISTWEVGLLTSEKVEIVFHMELYKSVDLGKEIGYSNLYRVGTIRTKEGLRGRGIATELYRFLIKNEHLTIMGSSIEYFGTRQLWASLSNEIDIQVDFVDVKDKKIIAKKVILHKGKYDADFDKRFWSYGVDKRTILPILVNL